MLVLYARLLFVALLTSVFMKVLQMCFFVHSFILAWRNHRQREDVLLYALFHSCMGESAVERGCASLCTLAWGNHRYRVDLLLCALSHSFTGESSVEKGSASLCVLMFLHWGNQQIERGQKRKRQRCRAMCWSYTLSFSSINEYHKLRLKSLTYLLS